MGSSAQQSGGQEKHRANQRKYRAEGNPNQPQRQREQPHEREKNQRQHCERPAQHKQNAPSDKENQRFHRRYFNTLNARQVAEITSRCPRQTLADTDFLSLEPRENYCSPGGFGRGWPSPSGGGPPGRPRAPSGRGGRNSSGVNLPSPFLSNFFKAALALAISFSSMIPSPFASSACMIGITKRGPGPRCPGPGPPGPGPPSRGGRSGAS